MRTLDRNIGIAPLIAKHNARLCFKVNLYCGSGMARPGGPFWPAISATAAGARAGRSAAGTAASGPLRHAGSAASPPRRRGMADARAAISPRRPRRAISAARRQCERAARARGPSAASAGWPQLPPRRKLLACRRRPPRECARASIAAERSSRLQEVRRSASSRRAARATGRRWRAWRRIKAAARHGRGRRGRPAGHRLRRCRRRAARRPTPQPRPLERRVEIAGILDPRRHPASASKLAQLAARGARAAAARSR